MRCATIAFVLSTIALAAHGLSVTSYSAAELANFSAAQCAFSEGSLTCIDVGNSWAVHVVRVKNGRITADANFNLEGKWAAPIACSAPILDADGAFATLCFLPDAVSLILSVSPDCGEARAILAAERNSLIVDSVTPLFAVQNDREIVTWSLSGDRTGILPSPIGESTAVVNGSVYFSRGRNVFATNKNGNATIIFKALENNISSIFSRGEWLVIEENGKRQPIVTAVHCNAHGVTFRIPPEVLVNWCSGDASDVLQFGRRLVFFDKGGVPRFGLSVDGVVQYLQWPFAITKGEMVRTSEPDVFVWLYESSYSLVPIDEQGTDSIELESYRP